MFRASHTQLIHYFNLFLFLRSSAFCFAELRPVLFEIIPSVIGRRKLWFSKIVFWNIQQEKSKCHTASCTEAFSNDVCRCTTPWLQATDAICCEGASKCQQQTLNKQQAPSFPVNQILSEKQKKGETAQWRMRLGCSQQRFTACPSSLPLQQRKVRLQMKESNPWAQSSVYWSRVCKSLVDKSLKVT